MALRDCVTAKSIASQLIANVGVPKLAQLVRQLSLAGGRNHPIDQHQPSDTHTTYQHTGHPSCCVDSPVPQIALYTVTTTGYRLADVQLHRDGSTPALMRNT